MKSEKEIILQVINGQTNQFEILVKKYQQTVYNVICKIVNNRYDAEELTQDVFVKSYESIHQYNPDYKFFSWIYRIAINSALQFNKNKKKQVLPEKDVDTLDLNLEGDVDNEKRIQLINTSINNLDPKYRSVILLKYYAKLPYTQIAEILDISEKMVKSRLFEGRKILKENLIKINYFTQIQYS